MAEDTPRLPLPPTAATDATAAASSRLSNASNSSRNQPAERRTPFGRNDKFSPHFEQQMLALIGKAFAQQQEHIVSALEERLRQHLEHTNHVVTTARQEIYNTSTTLINTFAKSHEILTGGVAAVVTQTKTSVREIADLKDIISGMDERVRDIQADIKAMNEAGKTPLLPPRGDTHIMAMQPNAIFDFLLEHSKHAAMKLTPNANGAYTSHRHQGVDSLDSSHESSIDRENSSQTLPNASSSLLLHATDNQDPARSLLAASNTENILEGAITSTPLSSAGSGVHFERSSPLATIRDDKDDPNLMNATYALSPGSSLTSLSSEDEDDEKPFFSGGVKRERTDARSLRPRKKLKTETSRKRHMPRVEWPLPIEGPETTIQCDDCKLWYHAKCVGIKVGDPRLSIDDAPFTCPRCSKKPGWKHAASGGHSHLKKKRCAKPHCSSNDEFEIESVMGRQEVQNEDMIEYLVRWTGYPIEMANWEPAYKLNDHHKLIQAFVGAARAEGRNLSLAKVVLKDAEVAGW